MNMFQGRDPLQGADRGCELQDRGVQGVGARQGVQDGVRENELQRVHQRGPLPALHWEDAPDPSSPPISR